MLLDQISKSNFLKGDNSRGWRITFDWLVKEGNADKVMEGNYENSSKQSAKAHSPGRRRYPEDRPIPKPPKDDWKEILIREGMNKPIEDLCRSAARIKHIHAESARKLACR